ncbi:unnamed protein product [Hermetia illucens]|uniref:CLIP domain-containing serine protease n=1 Tax=Hermetia illucens TaxID=343691 RepID=A0A7R8UQZ1_HERIL|nr:CLIP domain-containing serine protease 2 isoform X2 [Hermetia illucens]CAD7085331.1 unnamed protein product [Hermetia illucens]
MHLAKLLVTVLAVSAHGVATPIVQNPPSELPAGGSGSGLKVAGLRTCTIPNQSDKGWCVIVSECESYVRLRSDFNLTAEEVNFLKRVQCEDDGIEPRICCPEGSGRYVDPHVQFSRNDRKVRLEDMAKVQPKKHRKRTGAPKSGPPAGIGLEEECGKQLVNRIYGGEIAELDEYPWMALLVYNSNEFGCAGALISRRYVLTAAHCVSGAVFEEKKGLKSVRLGEYNTNTEPDCIQEINHVDCADSAVDVAVENIIIHPDYNESARDMQHDIALLRLKQNVRFTHFIMPICLPVQSHNHSITKAKGAIFTVAGWGRTNLFNKFRWNMASPIKLKLRVPIVDRGNCSQILQPYGVKLGPKQICAGGETSKDTCLGDSGGPLMRFDEALLRWVTHGVVSYGFTQCGVKGYPAVYTNVAEYIDWILNVIKN